jgi:hypothetical protein
MARPQASSPFVRYALLNRELISSVSRSKAEYCCVSPFSLEASRQKRADSCLAPIGSRQPLQRAPSKVQTKQVYLGERLYRPRWTRRSHPYRCCPRQRLSRLFVSSRTMFSHSAANSKIASRTTPHTRSCSHYLRTSRPFPSH